MSNSLEKTNIVSTFINILVGGFFLLILVFKNGYEYTPMILALFGILFFVKFFCINKEKIIFSRSDKILSLTFLIYFSVFILSILFQDGLLKELDKPSRAILLLPLLFLFKKYSLNYKWLFHIIPIGSLIAGITALIHRYYLGYNAAFAFQMQIQAGDMAMSLGIFSLIICLYFLSYKQYKFVFLYIIFSIMGILASILSTARGGWIGVPFVLFILFFCYRHFFSKRTFLSLIFISIGIGIFTVSIPGTKVMDRINLATVEINDYLTEQNKSSSVGARLDMWKAALMMAKESPVLGWGSKGSDLKRKEYKDKGIITAYAASFSHAHNQFLDDLSKRGIIGLVALLAVFFVPMKYFIKYLSSQDREIKTISLLGISHIILVMFYSLTQAFFMHNSGNIFYFFLVIVYLSLLNNNINNNLN